MTQKIVPNIWCDRNAAEAGEFYSRALPWTRSHIGLRYPADMPTPDDGPPSDLAGEPVVVDVDVAGFHITLMNVDDTYHPTPAISLMLNFDPELFDGDAEAARAALEKTWTALSDGGQALMPLDAYPFSPYYG
ncbi:VOC family protein [Microbacterium sp. USHLN186]|uniref:VOC family protein n=1 Tax=Microbacterium sp. USHLN186 TaxID=3081286 RepID=UPI0030175591